MIDLIKEVIVNRKAYHDYFIFEKFEAGISLLGSEIKSIRKHPPQIKDAYISFKDQQAIIKNMHIAHYSQSNIFNHQVDRERKLLLHKAEIKDLDFKSRAKGYTVVILKLYFKNQYLKVEIALAKGKHLFDKRASEKEKTIKKEIMKEIKYRY